MTTVYLIMLISLLALGTWAAQEGSGACERMRNTERGFHPWLERLLNGLLSIFLVAGLAGYLIRVVRGDPWIHTVLRYTLWLSIPIGCAFAALTPCFSLVARFRSRSWLILLLGPFSLLPAVALYDDAWQDKARLALPMITDEQAVGSIGSGSLVAIILAPITPRNWLFSLVVCVGLYLSGRGLFLLGEIHKREYTGQFQTAALLGKRVVVNAGDWYTTWDLIWLKHYVGSALMFMPFLILLVSIFRLWSAVFGSTGMALGFAYGTTVGFLTMAICIYRKCQPQAQWTQGGISWYSAFPRPFWIRYGGRFLCFVRGLWPPF